MSPLKTAFIATVAAVLLTSGWQYRQHQIRFQEAVHLRAENDRLRWQTSQRHEAEILKSQRTNGASVSSAAAAAVASASSSGAVHARASESNYRNEGQATPINTLQTLAWACDRGDAVVMAKLIQFDDTARRKTVDYMASLPPAEQAQWASPEAAAVALYLSDGIRHPYPEADMLQRATFEELSPTRVLAHLPGANGDRYEYQKTPDGWKLAVTNKVVDDYISEASQSR